MFLVKFILYVTIASIVCFLVWNSLKRIFFNQFYNYFPHQKMKNEANENNKKTSQKSNSTNKKPKWDAETVEYEEV